MNILFFFISQFSISPHDNFFTIKNKMAIEEKIIKRIFVVILLSCLGNKLFLNQYFSEANFVFFTNKSWRQENGTQLKTIRIY